MADHFAIILWALLTLAIHFANIHAYRNASHHIRLKAMPVVNVTLCDSKLGCFSNGPPFYHSILRPVSKAPLPSFLIPTIMNLYTRRNFVIPFSFHAGHPPALRKSHFNPKAYTRIIVYGYNDNLLFNQWTLRLKTKLLMTADDNVIRVNWSPANFIFYAQSSANCRLVGAKIASFIRYVHESMGTPYSRFHIIGHSLGAHIGGYVGQLLPGLGRITGLDPAGPFFHFTDPRVRLDPTDALFVDVIHTNPHLIGYGIVHNVGHLDFYPGGGNVPGCDFPKIFVPGIPLSPIEYGVHIFGCRHFRSTRYLPYSFNQKECTFVGVECPTYKQFLGGQCNCGSNGENCAIMGMYAPSTSPRLGHEDRKFFLQVGFKEPFCVHQYQVIINIQSMQLIRRGLQNIEMHLSVKGTKGDLDALLKIRLKAYQLRQSQSFLLTTKNAIGRVHSTFASLHHLLGEKMKGFSIFENIRITYLFPKSLGMVSDVLCADKSGAYGFQSNGGILASNFCFGVKSRKLF